MLMQALTDDHQTIYATYVYGNLTLGYQMSEVDTPGTQLMMNKLDGVFFTL